MAVPQKTFIRSSQVTNRGPMRMGAKQNNSRRCVFSKASQSKESCFWKKSLRSKCWPVSSAKLVMWRLFHLSIVWRSILSGTPQFICPESSEKFEKWKLYTMAMRALTHRLKSAPYWLAKTSNWWVIRRTALNWHPMTSLHSHVLEVSQSE